MTHDLLNHCFTNINVVCSKSHGSRKIVYTEKIHSSNKKSVTTTITFQQMSIQNILVTEQYQRKYKHFIHCCIATKRKCTIIL